MSFDVAEGETVGIMGANGAGKTTLFSLIAGNRGRATGDIDYEGRPITGSRPTACAASASAALSRSSSRFRR